MNSVGSVAEDLSIAGTASHFLTIGCRMGSKLKDSGSVHSSPVLPGHELRMMPTGTPSTLYNFVAKKKPTAEKSFAVSGVHIAQAAGSISLCGVTEILSGTAKKRLCGKMPLGLFR